MPKLNKQIAEKFIEQPDLSRFQLNPDQLVLAQRAIIKIKISQLIALANDVTPLVKLYIDDEQKDQALSALRIALYDGYPDAAPLSPEIFPTLELSVLAEQEDLQLKQQLNSDYYYPFAYNLRHLYFLNKPDKFRFNPKAFPANISERLLQIGHSYVSRYLKEGCSDLTKEEIAIIHQIYSEEKLKRKIFRREAHCDIALTTLEIQTLIWGIANHAIKTGQLPQEEIQPCKLSVLQSEIYTIYSADNYFKLIKENNLAELKRHIEKLSSLSLSIRRLPDQLTMLMFAVKGGKEEIVQYLLSLPLDLNATDGTDYTALHFAAEEKESKFLPMLLAKGCSINIEDRGGYTPLYIAAETGNAANVRLLLEKGADPNLNRNRYRSTALHIAVRQGYEEVISALLASKNVNIHLKDKENKTAAELAMERNPDKLFKLFENYNKKLTSIIPPKITPTVPTQITNPARVMQLTPAFLYQQTTPIMQMIDNFGKLLAAPKYFRPTLTMLGQMKVPNGANPFPLLVNNQPATMSLQPSNLFSVNLIEEEETALTETANKFQSIVGRLQQSREDNITFAQRYFRVLKLLIEVYNYRLSVRAFLFEVFRLDGLEILVNLSEKKSALQVAILSEDVDAINEIIMEEPDRSNIIITCNQKNLTEIEYAINEGKLVAVNELIALAQKYSHIKLGHIPDKAQELTQAKKIQLENETPAYKEAAVYFDVPIREVTAKNIKKLLRNLIITCPVPQAINGFFTPDEYTLLKHLLAEKENKSLPKNVSLVKFLGSKIILQHRLQKPLNEASGQPEEKQLIADALKKFSTLNLLREWQNNQKIYIDPKIAKAKNIFKHATSKIEEIIKVGKLATVENAIRNGLVRLNQVSTPEGTRHNIFFTQNSPTASITRIRENASHVIELDIVKAINSKLLAQDDIYTSPHLPAFTAEHVETPIVFIGSDPTIKTIYRVHHFRDKNGYHKMHTYDYYKNDALHSSHREIYNRDEEFFMGDNVKTTAYRLIYQLRRIKGPFESGSYYHYVLENKDNLDIINSCRAAIFNVMNVEGKIGKDIDINHDAVKIVEHDRAKPVAILNQQVITTLKQMVNNNDLQELQQYIKTNALTKEQLMPYINLDLVIVQKKVALFKCFLDLGVEIEASRRLAVFTALNSLRLCYFKNNLRIDSTEFKAAREILSLLLYHGRSDDHDPQHIRFATTIDNKWHQSKNGLELDQLKLWLIDFRNHFEIQKILLDAITKYTLVLYDYTFVNDLHEAHLYLAKRLGLEDKAKNPELAKLYRAVCDHDVFTLKNFLLSLRPEMILQHFNLLLYAIKSKDSKNEMLVQTLYPFFVDASEQSHSLLLENAIKVHNTSIVKILLALGIPNKKNPHSGLTPFDLALIYQAPKDLVYLLAPKEMDPESIAQHAFERGHEALATQAATNALIAAKHVSSWDDVSDDTISELTEKYIEKPIFLNEHNKISVLLKGYGTFGKEHPQFYTKFLTRWLNFVTNLLSPQTDSCINVLREFIKEIQNHNLVESIFLKPTNKFFPTFLKVCTEENLQLIYDCLNSNLSKRAQQKMWAENRQKYLYAAIESNYLGSLKFLKNNNLLISYPSNNKDKGKLLAHVIKYSKGKTTLLEFLLNDGMTLPDIQNRAKALAYIIIFDYPEILKWLFEKGYLQKNDLTEDSKNYLHLIIEYLLKYYSVFVDEFDFSHFSTSEETRGYKSGAAFTYLVKEIGIDINHLDQSGKHILNLKVPTSQFARHLDLFRTIESHPEIDWTYKNKVVLLHHVDPEDITIEFLEKYLSKGGDINALNEEGHTLNEHYLLSNKKIQPNIANKFKLLGGTTRQMLPTPNIHYVLITAKINNKIYLRVENNSICFFNILNCKSTLGNFEYFNHKSHNIHLDFYSFPHMHFHNPQKSKMDSTHSINFRNYSWTELPTQFKKIADDVYEANCGAQTMLVNEFTLILLQQLSKKPEAAQQQPVSQYDVDDETFLRLKQAWNRNFNNIKQLYTTLVNNDEQALRQLIARVQQQQLVINISWAGHLLTPQGYKTFIYTSFLEAAISTFDIALVRRVLQENVTAITNSFSEFHPVASAISRCHVDLSRLILDFVPQLNVDFIYKSLKFLATIKTDIQQHSPYCKTIELVLTKALELNSTVIFRKNIRKVIAELLKDKEGSQENAAIITSINELVTQLESLAGKRKHNDNDQDKKIAKKTKLNKAIDNLDVSINNNSQNANTLATPRTITHFFKRKLESKEDEDNSCDTMDNTP